LVSSSSCCHHTGSLVFRQRRPRRDHCLHPLFSTVRTANLIVGESLFAGITILWGLATGISTPQFLPG
jgi:hypothetical protein